MDTRSEGAEAASGHTRGEVKTLAKGLQILDLLIERQEIRTSEAARLLDIDKGGASRLLQTLVQAGYAEHGAGRGFKPGPKLAGRRPASRPQTSLREQARPILAELARATGETAHLGIPADENVLYLDSVDTPLPLRVDRPAGTLAPAYCTALGKAMLAFDVMPLPREMKPQTIHTTVEPGAFMAKLQQIAADRYALDDEEYHVGVRCAAAPVFDSGGAVVAAIGVSGPTARIDAIQLQRLGILVRDAAARIKY